MLQGVERTIRQGHPKDPQKHGPYYQLSFTWRGKSRTRFVRAERLAGIREKIASYKRFRELTDRRHTCAGAGSRADPNAHRPDRGLFGRSHPSLDRLRLLAQ